MKKFSYLLLTVSILLLTSCPGEVIVDPDDPEDPKEALLKQKIEALVSPDLMKAIKGLGMPIHDGITPPNIEGKYLADDQTMKKSNFEDDDPPGTKYEDEILIISGQNNDNFTVTLKSETDTYSQTFSMVISGSGDRFTLYAPMDIQLDDNTRVKAVLLYSGRMKEGELHDFYSGTFISDKSYFGLGQLYYEADGVAKKFAGEESVLSTTVGISGGKLKGNTIEIAIPAGSFSTDTKVELKKQTGENVFGTNKASDYHTVTGLPADFSKPITITVTPDKDAGADLFMAMGEESFVPSLNKMEVNYSFVESTLKEGKYLFELQPAEADNDAKGKKMDLTFGLVKDFARKGGGTKSTRATSKFQIYYDKKKVNDYDANKLEKYLNDAYDELVNMGFSFSKRTSWPISAYLYNQQSYNKNRLGEFVPSKFGNNWGYMTFNAGYMSDETLMKTTTGHELFHLVQALYDPRWAFTKAISAGKFYWLDEATATWFEEIMAGEAYSSPTRQGHHMEPLRGIYKGADDNPQHYGYGMAAFVKSMIGQTDKTTPSKIYQIISEGAENPVRAINGGASKTVSEMYPFFLDEYFNGKVYPDFEQSSLLTAEGVQTWNIASEGDTLKTFDNAYPGISTKIFKLNLSYDGFDDNSTLIIKTDEISFAPKYVYKMQGGSVFKLLDMGKSELSITGLKQLQKDKALILAVVANSGYTDNNFKTTFNIVKTAGFKPIRAAVKLYIEGEANGSVSNVQATTGGIYTTNHIKGSFNKNTFTASFDTESGSDGDPLKIRYMGNFTITFNPAGDRIVSGTFKLERDRTWTDRDGTTANDYEIATFKIRDIPINTIWKNHDIFNADYEEKGANVGNKIYDVEYNSRYRDFNNTITTFSFDTITRLRVDVDLKEKE